MSISSSIRPCGPSPMQPRTRVGLPAPQRQPDPVRPAIVRLSSSTTGSAPPPVRRATSPAKTTTTRDVLHLRRPGHKRHHPQSDSKLAGAATWRPLRRSSRSRRTGSSKSASACSSAARSSATSSSSASLSLPARATASQPARRCPNDVAKSARRSSRSRLGSSSGSAKRRTSAISRGAADGEACDRRSGRIRRAHRASSRRSGDLSARSGYASLSRRRSCERRPATRRGERGEACSAPRSARRRAAARERAGRPPADPDRESTAARSARPPPRRSRRRSARNVQRDGSGRAAFAAARHPASLSTPITSVNASNAPKRSNVTCPAAQPTSNPSARPSTPESAHAQHPHVPALRRTSDCPRQTRALRGDPRQRTTTLWPGPFDPRWHAVSIAGRMRAWLAVTFRP